VAISVTLPENYVEFTREQFTEQRDLPGGVYVLFDVYRRCLYVGQSKSPAHRIRQHLTGHGNSEDFSDMIAIIRIYYVASPFDRDIYETYAINEYKGKFNRAKSFSKKGPSRIELEMLEDIRIEISLLETKLYDLMAEREAESFDNFVPKPKICNFTGDWTRAYAEHIELEELRAEVTEMDPPEITIDYDYEISEIEQEINSLKEKQEILQENTVI
jgi:hypothetical protein